MANEHPGRQPSLTKVYISVNTEQHNTAGDIVTGQKNDIRDSQIDTILSGPREMPAAGNGEDSDGEHPDNPDEDGNLQADGAYGAEQSNSAIARRDLGERRHGKRSEESSHRPSEREKMRETNRENNENAHRSKKRKKAKKTNERHDKQLKRTPVIEDDTPGPSGLNPVSAKNETEESSENEEPLEDERKDAKLGDDLKVYFLKSEAYMYFVSSDFANAILKLDDLPEIEKNKLDVLIMKAECQVNIDSDKFIETVDKMVEVMGSLSGDIFRDKAKMHEKNTKNRIRTVLTYLCAAKLYGIEESHFHISDQCIKAIKLLTPKKVKSKQQGKMGNISKRKRSEVLQKCAVDVMLEMLSILRNVHDENIQEQAKSEAFALHYISSTYSELEKFKQYKLYNFCTVL